MLYEVITIRYPGSAVPEVLVVGAMSPCGERKNTGSCDGETWWGSCYGTQLDIMAPGVKIPTTDRQGSNGYSSVITSYSIHYTKLYDKNIFTRYFINTGYE